MSTMQGEAPVLEIGGSAYNAAYATVKGKQWTEVILNIPPVQENILYGVTHDATSSKAPARLAVELDEQLGELRPPAAQPVRIAFEGVNAYLTSKARHTRMMRLCNIAGAVAAVRHAEGIEISTAEADSLKALDNLVSDYSQMR